MGGDGDEAGQRGVACLAGGVRKHAVVTGEPGVGKTCVLRALRHALGTSQTFRLTYCHNVTLGRRDFYRHLCHALGIAYGATAGDVFLSVSKAWDSRSLLSLILTGLPDLNDRLIMRRNRSLLTRLTYRLSIEPLSSDDTAEYIRARLTAAGAAKEIFTTDAIAMLHEAASGSLRDIDRVAHNALRISARKKRKLVEREVVQAVLQLD
jgi:general secretion pathway protein A